MYINSIVTASNVDGPGNRIAIFLQGCNFICKYCHNPETIQHCNHCAQCVKVCHSNALEINNSKVVYNSAKCTSCGQCEIYCPNFSSPKVQILTPIELYEKIKRYLHFAEGITISGGEATLQSSDIEIFFDIIKGSHPNKSCFIDTNGSILLSDHPELFKLTDKFIFDVKAENELEHIALTGKPKSNILENIHFALNQQKIYEIRTVLTPLINCETTVLFVCNLLQKTNIPYQLIPVQKHGYFAAQITQVERSDVDTLLEKAKAVHYLCYKRSLL
ncbi:MAG: YjjW family glycine radical enzyme activase [Fusobacteria bacterium]|nr:YjjW family glycine radical enzyme activase [Fusobacteriota bacterium]